MPLALVGGRPIFFAHVPKTGGTAVEDYMLRRFGPLAILDRNKRRGVTGTGLLMPATHLAAIDLAELLPPGTVTFAMVRDPVDRLQSEYRYQQKASRASRLDFSTWLRVMLACLAREPRVYENHIRPQSDLVPEGAEIFHLERDGMTGMVAWLDAATGTTAPDVAVSEVNRSRARAPITLHREDVAAIEAAMAVDYDRFGFERRDQAALPADPSVARRRAMAAALASTIVARQRRRWVA